MKQGVIYIFIFGLILSLNASEINATASTEIHPREITREDNITILNDELKKTQELEAKYAKEQKFYDADSYDFKGAEVNKDSLKNIKLIEPDPLMDSNDFYEMPN